MITRWILEGLWASTTASVKRGYVGLKTDAKILSDNLHDLIKTPSEIKAQHEHEEHKEKYQDTVSQIKFRQKERRAIDQARKTVDTFEQKSELAFYKEKLNLCLIEVEKELKGFKEAYFPLRFRTQVIMKIKEKEVLETLLYAQTLREFKLLLTKQQQVLEKIGNKNISLCESINAIAESLADLQLKTSRELK